jgi:small subunit ribosomal protein S16
LSVQRKYLVPSGNEKPQSDKQKESHSPQLGRNQDKEKSRSFPVGTKNHKIPSLFRQFQYNAPLSRDSLLWLGGVRRNRCLTRIKQAQREIMVTIRLARGGAKKKPFYSIVVTDSRRRRDSGYIERVGYFNPMAKGQEVRLNVDKDRVQYWLSQGAKTSERVEKLLKEAA